MSKFEPKIVYQKIERNIDDVIFSGVGFISNFTGLGIEVNV